MDLSEAFLCASMKNLPVKPSIWMVYLKWTEILEWTAAMSEQSQYAWQFHNLPSDLARRGWRLLLIGEDHHCYASMHYESTIHRLLFSLVCHLQTILSFPSTNYSSSFAIWSLPPANYCFLLTFGVCHLQTIVVSHFDILILPSTNYCWVPIWSLTTIINIPPFVS